MDVVRTDAKQNKLRKKLTPAAIVIASLILGWSLLGLVKPAAPQIVADSLWFGEVKRGEMLREVQISCGYPVKKYSI